MIASLGKLGGAGLGAFLGGMNPREAISVGIGMNARGAMEIIIATVGLQAGIISLEIYSMLVIMAMVTSLMAGPLLQYSLGIRREVKLLDLIKQGGIQLNLTASDKEGAIGELVALMVKKGRLSDPQHILENTLSREKILGSNPEQMVFHGTTFYYSLHSLSAQKDSGKVDTILYGLGACHKTV